MRKIVASVLVLFTYFSVFAYQKSNFLEKKATTLNLGKVLISNQAWIKLPQYHDRKAWDQFFGENRTEIIQNGEKYLNYQWKIVTATDYLDYARSGNRKTMENPYNDNVGAVANLFMAELAEGKGRFMDQLINGVFYLCETSSWSLSAHLVAQKAKGSLPDNNDPIIDLASGNTGAMLSWIYYFMNKDFDKVNPLISKRLYAEIDRRIIKSYMNKNNWWMAIDAKPTTSVNNWNPWCNANVLQCMLLIEDDREELIKGVHKTLVSIDKFINYSHSDGACEEGPTYWAHAAGKLYDYLQLLSDATGGKLSVFDEAQIRNMGEYISRSYIGNGWVVNFADAFAKSENDYSLIYRYGKAVKSDEMMQFAAYCRSINPKKTVSIKSDIYRTFEDFSCQKDLSKISPRLENVPYSWYPETEFCYMREGRLFFAGKGGFNAESHNHNDVGTFSLYVDNTPVFIDAGVGTYTAKTFSRERYTLWNMQSDYHNLPRINGFSQHEGRIYKAIDTKFDNKFNTFSMDIAEAYPTKAEVNSWKRSYKLKSNSLEIEDVFDIKSPKIANQIIFLTWGKVDNSNEGSISITVGRVTTQLLYDKNKFESSVETKKMDDPRLSNIWGGELYRISLNAKTIDKRGRYKFKILSK